MSGLFFNLGLNSSSVILENHPLKNYCTLGAGGNAEIFCEPYNIEDTIKIFKYSVQNLFNINILGGGSNLLFSDGIINGVTISTRKLNQITWPLTNNKYLIEVEAGFKLADLLKFTHENNFGGFDFTVGIPGTVGGAVVGNAGTVDVGICELVEEIKTIEPDGNLKTWHAGEFNYSYRKNALFEDNKARLILSCVLKLRDALPDDKTQLENFIARRSKQPKGKTAGSTFKNPVNDSAGRLLEISGCKNFSEGGAVVSDKHANFIINSNNATATDIINLIQRCRERVFEFTNVMLEPEVRIIK